MIERYPSLRELYDDLTKLARARREDRTAIRQDERQGIFVQETRDLLLIRVRGVGEFWLSGVQREIVRVLLDAKLNCKSPDVPQDRLMRSAGTRKKVEEVFAGSKALGRLIVPAGVGMYRIADAAEDDEQEEEVRVVRDE